MAPSAEIFSLLVWMLLVTDISQAIRCYVCEGESSTDGCTNFDSYSLLMDTNSGCRQCGTVTTVVYGQRTVSRKCYKHTTCRPDSTYPGGRTTTTTTTTSCCYTNLCNDGEDSETAGPMVGLGGGLGPVDSQYGNLGGGDDMFGSQGGGQFDPFGGLDSSYGQGGGMGSNPYGSQGGGYGGGQRDFNSMQYGSPYDSDPYGQNPGRQGGGRYNPDPFGSTGGMGGPGSNPYGQDQGWGSNQYGQQGGQSQYGQYNQPGRGYQQYSPWGAYCGCPALTGSILMTLIVALLGHLLA